MFVTLNAVKALNTSTFLTVNDHFFAHPVMQLLEDLLGLRWSNVVECSGTDCKVAITGLESTAVGLESRKGEVFVAQTLSSSIVVHKLGGSYERLRTIRLESGPDNLHFDNEGLLWSGAHPSLPAVLLHFIDGRPCPAHVVRSSVGGHRGFHSVFYNSGTRFARSGSSSTDRVSVSGVSTGVVFNGILILGTVRDGFAVCSPVD